jgi:error-prone DNA polymerase
MFQTTDHRPLTTDHCSRPPTPQYVELHARSAFSFLRGAATPEELIAVCHELKMPAMALLDNDGVYGAARFHLAAQKVGGITAHIGAEITVLNPASQSQIPSSRLKKAKVNNQNSTFLLPLLIRSRTGYQNLCRLITFMKLRVPKHAKPGECAVTLDELGEYADGLICLTGDSDGPLMDRIDHRDAEGARRITERLVGIFGKENVYAELQRHFNRDEEARNHAVLEIAQRFNLPLLATNGVGYARRGQRQVADVFTCIRNHVRLETAGRLLSINSERFLKSPQEMTALFADLPEAIANTVELSSRLEFTLKDLGYEFPKYPVPPGETMTSFLRARTFEGARLRYGRNGEYARAEKQIEHELKLIEKLKLEGYFLIVWDIVEFCKRQGILIQGRGSAANSAVCYSLGITAVDPVGMELLFERFLSEERGEWPDIDLDLPSGDQREQAIQYVYERYGKLGAAMTANVITYRGRSAAREVGKVLGFDEETLGRLSGLVHTWEWKDPKDTTERQFKDAGLDLRDRRIRKFFQLYQAVQDLPRHLGQHSGGMVICQGQLDSVVPLEPAAMPGRVVVQWDKEDCADLGIIKVDLLGLGMMAALEETIQIIRDDYHEEVDLAHLPPDDPAVYAALQQADTIGMFQIESRAQMSCLPRLRPQRFYDIVVQVAIIRPGPIVGNMVNPYLERRLGRAPVKYAHPDLEPVLRRTLGVPLFQEQLLKMAMTCADFTGGEAEELRRAMGFKRSEQRMKEIEKKLRRGMTRKGIDEKTQAEIVEQIASFALYGFPESHAASFALIAYASAYLKCHYLAAFTAATLNNQPMGFYQPFTIIKDAQRHGLKVLPVDVTRSGWECTVERKSGQWSVVGGQRRSGQGAVGSEQKSSAFDGEFEDHPSQTRTSSRRDEMFIDNGNHNFSDAPLGAKECRSCGADRSFLNSNAINISPLCGDANNENFEPALRLGLLCVRGLRKEAGQAIVRTRAEKPFSSLDDLYRRVPELRKDELRKLAAVGALNRIEGIGGRVLAAESERIRGQRLEVRSRNSGLGNTSSGLGNSNSELGNTSSGLGNSSSGLGNTSSGLGNTSSGLGNSSSGLGNSSSGLGNSSSGLGNSSSGLGNSSSGLGNSSSGLGNTSSEVERRKLVCESRDPEISGHESGSQKKCQNRPRQNLDTEDGTSDLLHPIPHTQHPATHRRDALWQVERVSRDPGPLYEKLDEATTSPLQPMTLNERLNADLRGTGITIGRHPMAHQRAWLDTMNVIPSRELKKLRNGMWVKVAGWVIVRQRPGTAKGFVFLSLEDETGIANVIVTPQLFETNRLALVNFPFLLIEGLLQHQDNVVSVKARRIHPLEMKVESPGSHDFH